MKPIVEIKGYPCRLSLLQDPPEKCHPECKLGVDCFREIITSAVELTKTYRFRDEVTKQPCAVLPKLFEYMRDPKGRSVPPSLYAALVSPSLQAGDLRVQERRMREGYEMAFAWEVVARLVSCSARCCGCF